MTILSTKSGIVTAARPGQDLPDPICIAQKKKGEFTMSTQVLYRDDKEALIERYNETTTIQEYVMGIAEGRDDISVVAIMRHLPKFPKELTSLEYTVFMDRYFKHYSINEIVTLERISTFLEVEKALKRIDQKFKKWIQTL